MSHSTEEDQSDREDILNAAFHHLFEGAPISVDKEDLCKLMTEVSGHTFAYISLGVLIIIERFDEIKLNSEQPYKATLEFVIDANLPTVTVYSYLKAQLV